MSTQHKKQFWFRVDQIDLLAFSLLFWKDRMKAATTQTSSLAHDKAAEYCIQRVNEILAIIGREPK